MNWTLSLFISSLAGLVGLFVAGLIAIAWVDWYRVTSFEGASGYFVIAVALLGGLFSSVVGLIVSRIVAGGADPGFAKALGFAVSIVVGIGLFVTAVAFAFRDRTPRVPIPEWSEESEKARREAEEQAAFDSIPADAPIRELIPYTAEWQNETRRAATIERITGRDNYVAELGALMLDSDKSLAGDAMQLVANLPNPDPEIVAAMEAVGNDLIARIRMVNETSPETDPSFEGAAEVAYRFSVWISAVRRLREKGEEGFLPELQEILNLSRIRTESHTMQQDVRRVASHYLHLWTGIEPVPGDSPDP